MPHSEFEAWLALLSRMLRLSARQRDEIRRELSGHLEDALADELARGAPREAAILRILEDFGDAAELAVRFGSIGRKRRWIMRSTAAAACIGFAAFVFYAAMPNGAPPVVADTKPPAAQARGEEAPLDAQIRRALETTLAEVAFQDVPFGEAVAYFEETLKVNIHTRWGKLQDCGIERDRIINAKLKGLSAERVLRLVLDDVGGSDMKLAYEIEDGVLVISTEEDLDHKVVARVYDVRDIVAAAAAWSRTRPFGGADAQDVPPASGHAVAPTGSPGGGMSASSAGAGAGGAPAGDMGGVRPAVGDANEPAGSGDVTAPARQPRELRYWEEELVSTVIACVEPDAWQSMGGSGSISAYGGTLVIRQPERVQRKVEALLVSLRSALGREESNRTR